MLSGRKVLASAFVFFFCAAACNGPNKIILGPSRLTGERLSVYQGFLDKLGAPLHIKNLASLTLPFDFKGFPEGRPCLTGIELENPSEAVRSTHEFGPEILKGRTLTLVDRHKQLKLLSDVEAGSTNKPKPVGRNASKAKDEAEFVIFSEIAFDTKHQFAVLKFLLVCGYRCDSGATLVMERVGDRWTPRRGFTCALFINNSWSEMPD